jgi:hypothetical protein
MHADFKIRVDIRGPKAAIAWRCRCQEVPNSEAISVDTPDALAWFNKLLNEHKGCAAKPLEPTPPTPTNIPDPV